MIRKPQNWENVQVMTDRAKLPVGAYVCKVKQVGIQHNDYGDQLAILFDIAEGDHKDFYSREFQQNPNQNKKWKGVIRIWLPKDDGSDKDEKTKRLFKGMVTSFEESNPGFHWNWDESTLVGKTIGIIYRNEEWEYNGRTGWTTEAAGADSIDSIRDGKFYHYKDKPLPEKPASAPAFEELDDSESDLPF